MVTVLRLDLGVPPARVAGGGIVVVVGPTASGKSHLAVELAKRLGGEVVNADSMQLYRGMDVGTAKVTPAEQAGIRHHLLDLLDVTDSASVAEFQMWARAVIDDCRARGVIPVVVGGSSLYIRAVIDRLDFPGTNPVVRARWEERLAELGSEALHAQLAWLEPEAAELILPSNGRRIVRALEAIELTGSFTASMPPHEAIYDDVTLIGLEVPRDELDQRIALRVDRMWAEGLVDEVKALLPQGLRDGFTAAKAIGYREVLDFLAGEVTEDEARTAVVAATRKFARKQDRMFHQDPRVHWLSYDDPALANSAEAVVVRP